MVELTAVVFDWGGVLIEHPTAPMIDHLAGELGVDAARLRPAIDGLMPVLQTGELEEEELWEAVCGNLGVHPPEGSLWERAFEAVYVEQEQVLSVARQLKEQGHRVGFLSNTEEAGVRLFERQGYDFFDAAVYSCHEGVSKPAAPIYLRMCERLGVEPAEAVMVDDLAVNISGARQVGMAGILFRDADQLRAELRELGFSL